MGRLRAPTALTSAPGPAPLDVATIDLPREAAAAARTMPDKANSLTGSVYQQLRSDLLSGYYRPDEKLRAEDLRRRFNIGSSPIREALNRLLAEGFVALEEQKGFRVAPVSGEELEELVRARCLIDGAAVAECIRRYETGWEEGLVLALHRLSRVARRTLEAPTFDNPEWERLHRALPLRPGRRVRFALADPHQRAAFRQRRAVPAPGRQRAVAAQRAGGTPRHHPGLPGPPDRRRRAPDRGPTTPRPARPY